MINLKNTILYHGSRTGIIGKIQPEGRSILDFGKGFYMGTKREQTELLVLEEPDPIIYTLNLHLENIPQKNILTFSNPMEWAFFVLYNRNLLENFDGIQNTEFYKKLANMSNDKDIIIGPIADDNMTMIMRQFVNGTITDKTFMETMRCIDWGSQYVAKTKRACEQIEIIKKEKITTEKRETYHKSEAERRRENNKKMKITHKQYRREGRYLNEILEEYQQSEHQKETTDTTTKEKTSLTRSEMAILDEKAKEEAMKELFGNTYIKKDDTQLT